MDDDGTDPFGSHGEPAPAEPIGYIDGEKVEDLNARWAERYQTND